MEESDMALRGEARTRVTYFVVFFAILLVIVGVIGTGDGILTEGHTGHFNPAELEGPANVDCMIWLPGLVKELLREVVFSVLGAKVNLANYTAPMEPRNGGPLLHLPAYVRRGPMEAASMREVELISAPVRWRRRAAKLVQSSLWGPMPRQGLAPGISLWRGTAALLLKLEPSMDVKWRRTYALHPLLRLRVCTELGGGTTRLGPAVRVEARGWLPAKGLSSLRRMRGTQFVGECKRLGRGANGT